MKLALIETDGTAHCLVCRWKWKVPSHRRGNGRGGLKNLVLLSKEERVKLLEERILAHLRDSHDRIMLIRDEIPMREDQKRIETFFQKTYYSGRSLFGR